MGSPLWKLFLEEEVEDLQAVILTIGVHGLLDDFEQWMHRNEIKVKEHFKGGFSETD